MCGYYGMTRSSFASNASGSRIRGPYLQQQLYIDLLLQISQLEVSFKHDGEVWAHKGLCEKCYCEANADGGKRALTWHQSAILPLLVRKFGAWMIINVNSSTTLQHSLFGVIQMRCGHPCIESRGCHPKHGSERNPKHGPVLCIGLPELTNGQHQRMQCYVCRVCRTSALQNVPNAAGGNSSTTCKSC